MTKQFLCVSLLCLFTTTLLAENKNKPVGITMIKVPGGQFTSGSPKSEKGRNIDEFQRNISVDSFLISATCITKAQFKALARPYLGWDRSGDNTPIRGITWLEAVNYCNLLSLSEGLQPAYTIEKENVTCDFKSNGYRLPTDAEWEYAARGGPHFSNLPYAGSDQVNEVAWYTQNTKNEVQPVGLKKPNPLGLYDMAGNVYQMCWDWYDTSENYKKDASNPTGPSKPTKGKVMRGGCYNSKISDLRSASRAFFEYKNANDVVGFRVVRSK